MLTCDLMKNSYDTNLKKKWLNHCIILALTTWKIHLYGMQDKGVSSDLSLHSLTVHVILSFEIFDEMEEFNLSLDVFFTEKLNI